MTAQGGPTGLAERALGPDLARGFMLLFIALANSHYFVHGTTVFGGFPMDGSVVDRGVGFLISTFVDGRAFPMFALLFGYGVAQIVRRLLIGLWGGRRRVLERPAEHLTLLRTTAIAGITVAVVGALPVSLVVGGVIDLPRDHTLSIVGPLHDSAGVLGGFGYAALIVLIALRLRNRQGPLTVAIAAAGQRLLTCYLAQSVVWAVVFTPYLLDLSRTLSTTTTALLAVATWLATVVLADRMRRRNHRGPFEILIRRFTYRSPKAAAARSAGGV